MDTLQKSHTLLETLEPEHTPKAPLKKPFYKNPKKIIPILLAILLAIAGASLIFGKDKNDSPAQTSRAGGFSCPDEVIYNASGAPEVIEKGVKRPVRGQEEITYLDTHCKKQGNQTISFFDREGCTNKESVSFTKPIISLSELGQITPLGRMYDSHVTPTDHQYWQPIDKNAATKYSVYTPADGYIVELEQHTAGKAETTDMGATSTEDEYNITVEHSCGVLSIYHHLRSLPDSLKAQASLTTDQRVNRPTKVIRIPVSAGDQIGKVGGNTFDVQVADNKVTLKGFLKADTYKTEPWKVHTVDPISYYAEPLKSQYNAKVSRSVAPIGGKIDYDQAGKLVGNWFRKGTNGYNNGSAGRYWDGHLTIAYNQHNPKAVMVSSGSFLDNKSAQFYAGENATDPASIDAGKGAVRYSLYDYSYLLNGTNWDAVSVGKNLTVKAGQLKGYLLVQVQNDGTLKAEFFDTNGAQKSFSSNVLTLER